jgi:hypothetical protein
LITHQLRLNILALQTQHTSEAMLCCLLIPPMLPMKQMRNRPLPLPVLSVSLLFLDLSEIVSVEGNPLVGRLLDEGLLVVPFFLKLGMERKRLVVGLLSSKDPEDELLVIGDSMEDGAEEER